MDKRDWLLLNEIAAMKNISKAAEKLYLSQPAVSYRLQRMEKEYDTTLFIRNNRGVTLTSAGERLLSFSATMLRQYEEIYTYVSKPIIKAPPAISIGCSITFGDYYLPPQIHDFSTNYPGAQVTIVTGISSVIIDKLYNGELFLGVIRGDCQWDGPMENIVTESLLIIASKPIDEEFLRTNPLLRLSNKTGTTPIVEQWVEDNFGTLEKTLLAGSAGTRNLPALVRKGLGWTVIPISRIKDAIGLYCSPLYNKDGGLCRYQTHLCYSAMANHIDEYRIYKEHFLSFYHNAHFPDLEDYKIQADQPFALD